MFKSRYALAVVPQLPSRLLIFLQKPHLVMFDHPRRQSDLLLFLGTGSVENKIDRAKSSESALQQCDSKDSRK